MSDYVQGFSAMKTKKLPSVPLTLYAKLRATGLPMDSHESDLYVLDCQRTRDIIIQHDTELDFVTFRCAKSREMWLEVPFAHDPYWQGKHGFGRKTA